MLLSFEKLCFFRGFYFVVFIIYLFYKFCFLGLLLGLNKIIVTFLKYKNTKEWTFLPLLYEIYRVQWKFRVFVVKFDVVNFKKKTLWWNLLRRILKKWLWAKIWRGEFCGEEWKLWLDVVDFTNESEKWRRIWWMVQIRPKNTI